MFKQQDAHEIMSSVFEGLCGESSPAQELPTTTLTYHISCNKCLQIISNEEVMPILPLQVTSNVQASLNIFLQTGELTEIDSFLFYFCEIYQPASVDHEISKGGSYLVLQLKSFLNHHGNFIKDIKKV